MADRTIRRIVVPVSGGAEVLRLETGPSPVAGLGEALVAIDAAGVAYADVMMREGRYGGGPTPPFTPGYDLVGRILALGPGVQGFTVGQRVAAMPRFGAYAERIALPASELVPVPPAAGDADAVAVVLNYTTAYQLLHRVAAVRPNETVLLYSAAGGVGTAVLELCALHGVRVVGLASNAKLPLVRRLGADAVDYRVTDVVSAVREVAPDGVDAVLNPVGGRTLADACRLLKPEGRIVSFGNLSQEPPPQDLPVTPTWYSIGARKAEHREEWRQDLETLLQLLAEGRLHPVIAAELRLAAAGEAQRRLEAGDLQGKLVLRPQA